MNLLYGTRYTDLCCGMNAFWKQRLPDMAPDCDRFAVEAVVNLRMAKSCRRVTEVGSNEGWRFHGASHPHTIGGGFRVLRTILCELPTRPQRAFAAARPGP